MVIVRQEVRSRALCVIQILLSYVPEKHAGILYLNSEQRVCSKEAAPFRNLYQQMFSACLFCIHVGVDSLTYPAL